MLSKLNSDVKVSFVLGKSRLASIKEKRLTIPKLELQAALIAVRIKDKLVKETNVQASKLYFWSDSKTVLKFIRNKNTRFPTYVMHRINEIRSSSDISDWHFVPGKFNISDYCTCPTTFENIAKDNRYLNGPPFLYESLESVLKFGDIKEEEKDQVENNHMNTYQPTKVTSTFPWEHCSSFTKLIQHIALMKLFVRKWIFKTQSCMKLKLTASLLQESRTAIFEFVQRENFASELKYLQVSNVVSNQNKLLQLNPILDKS